MRKANVYEDTAFLYDYDTRDIVQADIPFYLEYATKYPGKILELACGTGRVAISLAKNGFKTYGIDLSDSMLEQLELKLALEPENVKSNIAFDKFDISDFDVGRSFSLVIIPFRSFQSLISEDSQRGCLKCVHKHLDMNGVFIVNAFKPYKRLDESWVYPEMVQWETIDENTGSKITKKHKGNKIDVSRQIIYPEMIYQITKPNGELKEFRGQLELKYYYYDQLKGLLESEGFCIVDEYGYYDKSDINQGKEMIFVCRKVN